MKSARRKFGVIDDLSNEEIEELHDDCRARAELMLNRMTKRQSSR
jgi:hypothetical protein